MNQIEAMRAMNRMAERSANVGQAVDTQALLRAAKIAASKVLQMAARSGHSVGIRVTEKANGIRITVTGPKAHRYRAIVGAELERLQPETAADIKAQIIRKIR